MLVGQDIKFSAPEISVADLFLMTAGGLHRDHGLYVVTKLLLFIQINIVTFKGKIVPCLTSTSSDLFFFSFHLLHLPLCLHFALLSMLELLSSDASLSYPEDIPSKPFPILSAKWNNSS